MSNGISGKMIFSRLLEGDDLAESLRKQAETNGIRAGFFILIGTLRCAALGYYSDGKYETFHLEGPLEIASCTGNVAVDEKGDTAIHAHIVVSNRKCEAFGGHLMKGCEVGATAELVMIEAVGVKIQRVYDDRTKLKLWKLG